MIATVAKAQLAFYSVAILALIGGTVYLFRKGADFNKGTPYAGAGAIGTLGNAANQLSGGTLAPVGAAIGATLFDWFNPPPAGPDIYYSVAAPGGGFWAVHGSDIDRNGYFERNGKRYRVAVQSDGQRFAVIQ